MANVRTHVQRAEHEAYRILSLENEVYRISTPIGRATTVPSEIRAVYELLETDKSTTENYL